MLVYLKTNAGLDVRLANGKIISLKGNGLLNEISEADFKELSKNAVASAMLESGHIVASNSKTERVADDLKSENTSKQAKEKSSKVKVESAQSAE